MSPPVLFAVEERVATITLHRPAVRNALTREMLDRLAAAVTDAEHDDHVDVIVLTGSDPAFCAGLDLDDLGSSRGELLGSGAAPVSRDVRGPLPKHAKPLIGAVNGVAVTGGLELALNCDFLVASERAKFGDTHTRVGVMPGWGLSVLLPQAVGIRRAREMSFTGNFVDAEEALALGLVNHVVAHDQLMPVTRRIAADISSNDQAAVRQLRHTYDTIAHDDDAWETESRDSRVWQRTAFDPRAVAERRAAIQRRGRRQ
jgi:enoyl-CoA hydratase/carnithine racemase